MRIALTIAVAFLCASTAAQKAPPAKPFERFDGCVREPDEWTDGDSFRVRLPDGRLETFRLYFVDTTESRSRGKRSRRTGGLFRTDEGRRDKNSAKKRTLSPPRRYKDRSRFRPAGVKSLDQRVIMRVCSPQTVTTLPNFS